MSETYSTTTTFADDIDDGLDTETARLSRGADHLLNGERRSFDRRVDSVRQALKDDVEQGRAWARERSESTRSAIQDEPMKATLYAVGIGVLIGLLLRR